MRKIHGSFVVEKGVPIPPQTRPGSGRTPKYPFPYMDKGDSFLFPKEVLYPYSVGYFWNIKLKPKKFLVRKTSEGYRCWRVD